MNDRLTIFPRRIIGTGDPMDMLTMIPLAHMHGYQRACVIAQEEGDAPCEEPIRRAIIVDRTDPPGVFGPGDALAVCEPHYKILRGESYDSQG